jgi:formylglycine-generating enzyme required for sulfatase activity
MTIRFLTLAVALAGLAISSTWADEPATAPASAAASKAAVPDAPALKEAQKLVHDVYAADIAKAKKSKEKAELAKKPLQAGIDAKNDPNGRYLLLGMARDMAIAAGDVDTTFAAIDELANDYQVDDFKLKKDAMAKLSRSPEIAFGDLIEKADAWMDEALVADHYDMARQFAELALTAARVSKDLDLLKVANERVREVNSAAAAYLEVKEAQAALAQAPSDPAGNLTVGRFYCMTKCQWDKGLPMLALGGDEALKDMAQKELAKPNETGKQVELGNAWCKLAERYPPAAQRSVREHAVEWCQKAAANLAGLEKEKLEKHVAELLLGSRKGKPAVDEMVLDLGKNVKMKLVRIPAGKFVMGCPRGEKGRNDWDVQPHEVILSNSFYMGACTVTEEQYSQVTGKNSVGNEKSYPAICNWSLAAEFCKALSKKTGKSVKLPTEAQWEYACRAGTTTRFNFGNDDDNMGDYAWYEKNSQDKVHPVGLKKPNYWGLYDMHGNVQQWCWDWYDGDNYYSAKGSDKDPKGIASGKAHIVRGSYMSNRPEACRSGFHAVQPPDYDGFGFRVVVMSGTN